MLFLSSLLTGVRVASTGYVLAKQVFGDMQKNTVKPDKQFAKEFRRTPKSKRAKLMKSFLEKKKEDEMRAQIYEELKQEVYAKIKTKVEAEVIESIFKGENQ